MKYNTAEVLKKYQTLVAQADAVFARVQKEYPSCVKCQQGCSECCYALFDLPFIEAIALNDKFQTQFNADERAAILDMANETDRKTYKIKKEFYERQKAGGDESSILKDAAKLRIRCPLLDEKDRCRLYEYRPITCRLYGIPLNIGGEAHTCGKSGFIPGKPYPTVHIEKIQNQLTLLNKELILALEARNVGLVDILVPVSMALITEYNDDYLGIKEETAEAGGAKTWVVPGPTEE